MQQYQHVCTNKSSTRYIKLMTTSKISYMTLQHFKHPLKMHKQTLEPGAHLPPPKQEQHKLQPCRALTQFTFNEAV